MAYELGCDSESFILCLECNRKSYNRYDIDQKYCGNCHAFHDVMDLMKRSAVHIAGVAVEEVEKKLLTFVEVLKSVWHMRQAQKAYFRSKSKGDLIESKRLETAVDIRLGELKERGVIG